MRINLIGNAKDGKGLASDSLVIQDALSGHTFTDVQYDAKTAPKADVNIFLEVCAELLHSSAPINVLIPNVELYFNTHRRTDYDAIWCKTRHAETVMRKNGRDPIFIGFSCVDIYRPKVKRIERAIHVAGGGRFRNTAAVVEAWVRNWQEGLPPLTVVAQKLVTDYLRIERKDTPGITFVERVKSRKEFIEMMNAHRYHVLPSEYEGFGTALWEARSCDAHLITTDAAPMNEADALAYVRVHALTTIRRGCLVSGHRVKPTAVWNAMLTSTFGSRSSRQAWLTNEERFTARILEVFNNLIQRPKRRKISGGRNFIVAVMATIPGREKECRLARESLERQGIKVHVWDKEVQGRTDDARKFIFPRAGYRGFVLTVDDDLIYPPTYARDMVDAVEQYGCAVSLHGKSFKPPINSYYKDASLKVRCLGDLEDDVEVQIPGTGAMAWHTDIIQFAIEDFPNKNMADIHAGIKCHREGVRVMALAHTSDYFKYQRVPDTIWDRAHDDDAVQTALINDHHWE